MLLFYLVPIKKYKKYGYFTLAPLTKKSKKYGIWPLPPLIKKIQKVWIFPFTLPPSMEQFHTFFLILPLGILFCLIFCLLIFWYLNFLSFLHIALLSYKQIDTVIFTYCHAGMLICWHFYILSYCHTNILEYWHIII